MGNIKEHESKILFAGGTMLVLLIVVSALFVLNIPLTPVGVDNNSSLSYFSTYSELVDYLKSSNQYSDYGGVRYTGGIVPLANAVDKAASQESVSATDFSTTNIQVEGVDEADIIKNDGKYVYAIADEKLFIVDAFPAESAKIISTTDFSKNLSPIEMFVSNNKLLMFMSESSYTESNYSDSDFAIEKAGSVKYYPNYYSNRVTAFLYDISDKSNPVKKKEVSIDGSYITSRLIGDNAYFVSNSYISFYSQDTSEESVIPTIRVDGIEDKVASINEIGIIPRIRPDSFITIASINLEDYDIRKQTVAGTAQNVYASEDNLYLVDNYWGKMDYNGPVPAELGDLVKSIYFPNLSSTQKTVVNKFELKSGKIKYAGQGIVPGYILNQFSMDEFKGNFRIATTVENYYSELSEGHTDRSTNNVYVLDEDMKVVGNLEGIAPDEKIYSVRFMGDKGYMVTFKYVDPLFVLDLSNPKNPKVLGKLKIPGYSDYLHPIDETHLLGIGRDVNELEDAEKVHSQGAVYYTAVKGVKMAIFDVSDVEHPKEISNYVIGGRGTDSEALNNHKAILFNKEKELLVLPITIVDESAESDYYGTEQSFQGAVVMNVSLENGLSERGKVTHVSTEEELKRGYYYGSESEIRRSLFMDDILYTFSENMLKANNLNTLEDMSEVIFQTPSEVLEEENLIN